MILGFNDQKLHRIHAVTLQLVKEQEVAAGKHLLIY